MIENQPESSSPSPRPAPRGPFVPERLPEEGPRGAGRGLGAGSGAAPDALSRCRVVLVRPQVAGNLGATARIMRNMGLTDLVLVAPEADPTDSRARRRSTHGEAILGNCRRAADLGEALTDCVLVVGTSARVGGLVRRQSVGTPEEILPRAAAMLAAGPVALVFGPEPTGLTNAEVVRCHYLVTIPTDPAYSSLNLAQAVAICLYELRRAWVKQAGTESSPEQPAPFADQERMFDHLRRALEEIHFLYGPKADSLMHALRHLIGRAGPRPMEVEVLFGLARQMRWFAAHGQRLGEPVDPACPESP